MRPAFSLFQWSVNSSGITFPHESFTAFVLYHQSNGLSYGEGNARCLIPPCSALKGGNTDLPSIWYLFPKTARQGHREVATHKYSPIK